MNDRHPAHAGHDSFLIAAHATGDLQGTERETAARLLDDCPACATLYADLRTIARATRDLPTPPRPRDFRLTPDDATRLRPAGWRRILHALAGPSFAFARPMGAALSTLGLAGLMLTAIPGVQLSGAASAPAPDGQGQEFYPAAAPTIGATGDGQGRSGGETSVDEEQYLQSTDVPSANGQAPVRQPTDTSQPTAPEAEMTQRSPDSALMILSGSFLIVGLGLFGLRWSARRLGDG
jgi:hypothetical protein